MHQKKGDKSSRGNGCLPVKDADNARINGNFASAVHAHAGRFCSPGNFFRASVIGLKANCKK
jgi:hypothetical protein